MDGRQTHHRNTHQQNASLCGVFKAPLFRDFHEKNEARRRALPIAIVASSGHHQLPHQHYHLPSISSKLFGECLLLKRADRYATMNKFVFLLVAFLAIAQVSAFMGTPVSNSRPVSYRSSFV
jgi:hypothetical protein